MIYIFTSCVFCFKQMAAYELRISDWSSDVCSSDLVGEGQGEAGPACGEAIVDLAAPRRRLGPKTGRAGVVIEIRSCGRGRCGEVGGDLPWRDLGQTPAQRIEIGRAHV